MNKELRGQRIYEAIMITILAIAIAFYVLITISMHNARYGNLPPHGNTAMHALASIMARVGFSAESVNAVCTAGIGEGIIALLALIVISVVVTCFCGIKTPNFARSKYGLLTIGVIIAALAILLQLNGSSIHAYGELLQSEKADAPLWGITRTIRSDEFAVWTPMAISQVLGGFPAISDVIGGGGTDAAWISVGGIPAINKALIFKPLYWGFILFGSSFGMSILWIGRSFLLFFATYYCAMICTGGKKHFSFAAASMVLFAPYVQWWFSQSIAEIIFYPELIFLAWRKYLDCRSIKSRIALSVLMAWLLGCLIMIAYPGWIIPMVYLLFGFIIYDCAKRRDRLTVNDALILLVPLLIAVGWLGLIAYDSRETLMAVKNSVYPGERLFTGGAIPPGAAFGLQTMMLPFTDPWMINSCELSGFVCFAPVGAALTLSAAVKNKKLKTADALLITAEVVILFIFVIGIPPAIAKITLLSICGRIECVFGIIDIVLLSRALSSQERLPGISGVLLTAMMTLLSYFVLKTTIPDIGKPMLCLITAAYFMAILTILVRPFQCNKKRYNRFLSCCIVMLMIIAGGFVNPIQKGVYAACRTDLMDSIRDVNDEKGDLYLCEGETSCNIANYLLMSEKRVFNSTQEYANTEKWKIIDPNGENIEAYNRFCHVSTEIVGGKTDFEVLFPDHIHVDLNIDDLKKIGIKYVVSQKDYTKDHGVSFKKTGGGDGWKIYRLSY